MTSSTLPLVSFLTLTYNQEQYIYEAVMSGLQQDYLGQMEIIVQDDCSTDNTEQEVLRAINDNPHPDRFHVKYAKNSHRQGLGGNMHDGLARCKGDIIVYNDGDDVSFPDRVSEVVRIFQTHPDVMLVSGEIHWLCNGVKCPPKEPFPAEPRLRSIHDNIRNHMRHEIWGCTPAYRREVIDKFPPMLTTTPTSDTWIQWRAFMLGNGKQSVYLGNKPCLYYRIHNRQLTGSQNMSKMKRTLIFHQYWKDWLYATKHRYICIYISFRILPHLLHYGIAALLQYNSLWRKYRLWTKQTTK